MKIILAIISIVTILVNATKFKSHMRTASKLQMAQGLLDDFQTFNKKAENYEKGKSF